MLLTRGAARAHLLVSDRFYRATNRKRPRLLIYTDSRGFDVVSRRITTSYVAQLRKKYHVTYSICPEKYTTIIDFLRHVEHTGTDSYDAVVMHCGIVDFSPRPLSSIERLMADKFQTVHFTKLFIENQGYYEAPLECSYRGEPTINLYSKDYLIDKLVPRLRAIPNLVWINSNHFVHGWDGNYTKGRPANIESVVGEFDEVMAQYLPHIVSLKGWSSSEIKAHTIDNIHFTQGGFNCVASGIDQAVERLLQLEGL